MRARAVPAVRALARRRLSGHSPAQRPVGAEGATPYPKLGDFAPAQIGLERDGLPRWPGIGSAGALLRSADYFGAVVFAVSGSVTAATVGLDALGCTIVGTITAVGGGTVRDAIILHKQPFWVEEHEYLLMAAAAALATFVAWPLVPSGNAVKDDQGGEGFAMWLGDAIGVGAFACIGAQNALRLCVHPAIATVCGMVTATFGGLTRDVLCGLPADRNSNGRILHSASDLYATTALAGAAAYIGARSAGLPYAARVGAGMGAAIGLRFAAKECQLGLPTWTKPSFLTEGGAAAKAQQRMTPVDSPKASPQTSSEEQ